MLTEHELNNVFSWLPYRDTWKVDRTRPERYYGDLINDFIDNEHFETFYSQDGGMTNYLEFLCYPVQHNIGEMNAVIVCVSLCAPVACYGQTTIYYRDSRSIGYDFLEVKNVGIVANRKLIHIEREIKAILNKHNLLLVDKALADQQLPSEIAENMENLNEGTKYLHGLFQWAD